MRAVEILEQLLACQAVVGRPNGPIVEAICDHRERRFGAIFRTIAQGFPFNDFIGDADDGKPHDALAHVGGKEDAEVGIDAEDTRRSAAAGNGVAQFNNEVGLKQGRKPLPERHSRKACCLSQSRS